MKRLSKIKGVREKHVVSYDFDSLFLHPTADLYYTIKIRQQIGKQRILIALSIAACESDG